jgi:hypothetical protein
MRAVLKTLTREFEFDPKKGGEVLVDNGLYLELPKEYFDRVATYIWRNDDGTYLVTLFPREKWG